MGAPYDAEPVTQWPVSAGTATGVPPGADGHDAGRAYSGAVAGRRSIDGGVAALAIGFGALTACSHGTTRVSAADPATAAAPTTVAVPPTAAGAPAPTDA